MTAVVDDFFNDLHYPGSKKLRRPAPEGTSEQEESWDARPIIKVYRGEKTELFFPISFAQAIGKSVSTIRHWERLGHIPKAPYRLPGYVDAQGNEHPGKRVYTRRLIEIAIEEFAARDLLNVKRVEWKQHSDLTIALLERWTADYKEK